MNRYLFVFAMAGLLSGCAKFGDPAGIKLSGTLELTEHAVGSRVPGRVASLLVDEGYEVKKGQLLVTLDRQEQTRLDYYRALKLYNEGGGTKQAVEQAELALSDQQVISPVDGIILTKVHEAGEIVSAGSPIVVIGNNRNPWVRVYVPEGTINRIKINQPAAIQFDGVEKTFKGHVSYVSPKAEFTPRNVQTPEERVTQTFAVKVTLDEIESYIHSGVAADVTLTITP